MDNFLDTNYNANSIKMEEGSEQYRARPAQYLSFSDTRAMENIFFEVLDNAIDEVIAYTNKLNNENGINIQGRIDVQFFNDGTVSVQDYGRGYPCEMHEKYGVPAIEIAIEKGSAGGKNRGTKGYSSPTAGVHGAGITVSMANCERFSVDCNSMSANGRYILAYEEGKKTQNTERIGDLHYFDYKINDKIIQMPLTGTKIVFKPSHITLQWKRDGIDVDFPYKEGLLLERLHYALIGEETPLVINWKFLDEDWKQITPSDLSPQSYLEDENPYTFQVQHTAEPIDNGARIINESFNARVYISVKQNNQKYDCKSIINRLNTKRSSTDSIIEEAIKEASQILVSSAKNAGIVPKGTNLEGRLFTESCKVLVVMAYANAEFTGQTKSIMESDGLRGNFRDAMINRVINYIDPASGKNKFFNSLLEIALEKKTKAEMLAKMTKEIQLKYEKEKAKEIKKTDLSEKLEKFDRGELDESEKDPNKIIMINRSLRPKTQSTIVVVEGKSIGSLISSIHDGVEGGRPLYIATLKGKLKNIVKNKSKDNIADVVFPFITKVLRDGYKNIAIATDGDDDGLHIRILVILLIWKYAPEYIQNGRVFIVPTPFSNVILDNKLEIFVEGEGMKKYKRGDVMTFSHEEHKTLVEAGARVDRIYKGLSDADVSPVNLIIDSKNWKKIETPTEREIILLKQMMTTGDRIKKTFTSLIYEESVYASNLYLKELGLQVGKVGNVMDNGYFSDNPGILDYNSIPYKK